MASQMHRAVQTDTPPRKTFPCELSDEWGAFVHVNKSVCFQQPCRTLDDRCRLGISLAVVNQRRRNEWAADDMFHIDWSRRWSPCNMRLHDATHCHHTERALLANSFLLDFLFFLGPASEREIRLSNPPPGCGGVRPIVAGYMSRPTVFPASGRERNVDSAMAMRDEDDDLLLEGALYKRRDFLDKEEAAKSHPNRIYYFRKPDDVNRLVELCSNKLRSNPADRKALHIRASAHIKRGDFTSAAADYSDMLKIDARDITALYNRGCAYEKLGRLEDAIKDFSGVLAIDPGFASAAYARGACQNRMGNFDSAIDDYTLALERDQARGPPSSVSPSSLADAEMSPIKSPYRHRPWDKAGDAPAGHTGGRGRRLSIDERGAARNASGQPSAADAGSATRHGPARADARAMGAPAAWAPAKRSEDLGDGSEMEDEDGKGTEHFGSLLSVAALRELLGPHVRARVLEAMPDASAFIRPPPSQTVSTRQGAPESTPPAPHAARRDHSAAPIDSAPSGRPGATSALAVGTGSGRAAAGVGGADTGAGRAVGAGVLSSVSWADVAALAKDDKSADVYHSRGYARRKEGQFALAVRDYSVPEPASQAGLQRVWRLLT
jgi:tetratricopeptide (TPR) repeat protein